MANVSFINIIPEVRIKIIVDEALKYVIEDFNDAGDETKTLLYYMFNGNIIGSDEDEINYFTEAKSLFLRKNTDPRKVKVRTYFDIDKATSPTVHLTLPSEIAGYNGIGVGEDSEFDIVTSRIPEVPAVPATEEEPEVPAVPAIPGTRRPVYTKSFVTEYHLICTSPNPVEVTLLYHFLKSLFISFADSMEQNFLQNLKISGQDIQMYSENVPAKILMRALKLEFVYDNYMPRFFKEDYLERIFIDKTKVSGNERDINKEV